MRRLDYQEVSDIRQDAQSLGQEGAVRFRAGLRLLKKNLGREKSLNCWSFMRFRMRPGLPILISAVPSCRKDRRFRLRGRKFRRP